MLELWTIEPTPTPKDPSRHTLWLKAQLADVQAIIRRFGALCGRPQKERAASEYNFSLQLHGAGPEVLSRMEEWLRALGPNGEAPASRPGNGGGAHPEPGVRTPPPVAIRDLHTPPPIEAAPQEALPPSAPAPASPFADLLPPAPEPAAPSPAPSPGLAAFSDLMAGVAPPLEALPPPASAAPAPRTPIPAASTPPTEAPPPLTEAPAWPAASPAGPGASPFGDLGEPGAPTPTSPFANLPPAPSFFPAPAEPAVAQPPMPAFGQPAHPAAPALAAPGATAGEASAPLEAAAPGSLGELFGALVPLNPAYTMETLQVGSYNRFSHAASMSVIANPGAMYNPLFLFGGPGVGKTHLLTAIGKSLQDASPGETVFMTTGPRLSRAVSEAKRLGRLGEIEAYAKKARALLIDDMHVLGVTEQNQEALAAILGSCFSSAKQVVMTSVYPPRALGGLEEALRFQISAGWSVDMKPVTVEVQKEILGPAMARAGFELDAALIDSIIPKLEGSFGELNRWVERLRALLELRSMNRQPSTLQDLFPVLLMPDVPATVPSSTEEIQGLLRDMPPFTPDPKALPMAVFFPQGREAHGEYVVRQFHAVMSQNRWPIQLRVVQSQAYDPEQLHGVPFTIGDACRAAGARVALVLGPNPGSGLAGREVELQHAVQHLLEGIDLRVGWISFLRIRENGPYFRAGLDLFTVFRSQG